MEPVEAKDATQSGPSRVTREDFRAISKLSCRGKIGGCCLLCLLKKRTNTRYKITFVGRNLHVRK